MTQATPIAVGGNVCLANLIFAQALLVIWLTWINKIRSNEPVCAKQLFKLFVLARLRVEYAHKFTITLRFKRILALGQRGCTEEGFKLSIS